MQQHGSSARLRPRSISPAESRWSLLQSSMWCGAGAISKRCGSQIHPANLATEAGAALALAAGPRSWLDAVDRELAELSWDRTWAQMVALIDEAASTRNPSTVSVGQEGIVASSEECCEADDRF
jgi:hypothetical protein